MGKKIKAKCKKCGYETEFTFYEGESREEKIRQIKNEEHWNCGGQFQVK